MSQDKPPDPIKDLTPQEMRDMFSRTAYNIAWKTHLHFPDKRDACEVVAREIMSLIDGGYSEEMPPFVLTPVPTPELNAHCAEVVEYTWPSDTPINANNESLVDPFDAARERHKRAALSMFKHRA